MSSITRIDVHTIGEHDAAGNHTHEVVLDASHDIMLSSSLYRAVSYNYEGGPPVIDIVAGIMTYHVWDSDTGDAHDVQVYDGQSSSSWRPALFDQSIQAVTFFIQQGTDLTSGRALFRMDFVGG